jgi:hypothetical protein
MEVHTQLITTIKQLLKEDKLDLIPLLIVLTVKYRLF